MPPLWTFAPDPGASTAENIRSTPSPKAAGWRSCSICGVSPCIGSGMSVAPILVRTLDRYLASNDEVGQRIQDGRGGRRMPATTSITLGLATGLFFSLAACAPPTPKIQQRPPAAPQSIEQRPQGPVREADRSFRPMVQEGSVTPPAHHG